MCCYYESLCRRYPYGSFTEFTDTFSNNGSRSYLRFSSDILYPHNTRDPAGSNEDLLDLTNLIWLTHPLYHKACWGLLGSSFPDPRVERSVWDSFDAAGSWVFCGYTIRIREWVKRNKRVSSNGWSIRTSSLWKMHGSMDTRADYDSLLLSDDWWELQMSMSRTVWCASKLLINGS